MLRLGRSCDDVRRLLRNTSGVDFKSGVKCLKRWLEVLHCFQWVTLLYLPLVALTSKIIAHIGPPTDLQMVYLSISIGKCSCRDFCKLLR